MFKFIANAFREIGHVVWPTPKETRTYMNYTVVTIIVLTIFLSVIWYGFRQILQTTKHWVNPASLPTATTTASPTADDVYKEFGLTPEATTVDNTGAISVDTSSDTGSETTNLVLPSEAEETTSAQ